MDFTKVCTQFSDVIASFEGRQGVSPWRTEREALRASALRSFLARGLPTRKDEDWKYTDLKNWIAREYRVPAWEKKIPFSPSFENHIVIHNGLYRYDLSKVDGLPDGVAVTPLREKASALRHHSETFYREIKRDVFFHLNEAFAFDGAVIEIADRVACETPLEIIHLTDDATYSAPRVTVKAGKFSEARIVERFVSVGGEAHFSNAISEVFLEAGAQIQYVRLQEENENSLHIGHLNCLQNVDSRCEVTAVSLGGGLSKHNINMRLLGAGASARLGNLYLTHGGQHADFCTVIDHAEPHCESDQLAKGILADKSRAVFNGTVRVRPKAQKTQAAQLNKNLILDPQAEINTRPQLQIDADDVKASHGATVGQLDPEELFYLQSRAIDRPQAARILAVGFAEEVIFRVRDDRVREFLQSKVRECFARFHLREKLS